MLLTAHALMKKCIQILQSQDPDHIPIRRGILVLDPVRCLATEKFKVVIMPLSLRREICQDQAPISCKCRLIQLENICCQLTTTQKLPDSTMAGALVDPWSQDSRLLAQEHMKQLETSETESKAVRITILFLQGPLKLQKHKDPCR